ncbi:hypothetical protein GCM10022419_033650 [Nonomuraea rosea]|uniref:Uncharacterized protein n=1 Tax=Nonomuraea rosea TaxID=638574 RepID=A0ABP6WHI4_9ACTN
MTWVKRAEKPAHTCKPPSLGGYTLTPEGQHGDLWRCDDCAKLWRIGYACGLCDWLGDLWAHDGQHITGTAWRRASRWQEIRYRKRGRR